MFDPKGIAVLGASPREQNLGVRFVRSLLRHRYRGDLYVVNRNGQSVEGVEGYSELAELPSDIELAVVAVPADHVKDAVTELGELGVANALVFSSGFAEIGEEGRAAEAEVLEAARSGGVRLLGPNCVGFTNVLDGVCPMASGFAFREHISPGSFGIIAQSGGVAGLIGERAQDHGIGVSLAIATGNEVDAGVADVLEHMIDDGRTESVAMYLESVRRPQELIDALARARDAGVGVAVFKAGTGERTAAAAAAHTGSLVGDDAAFDAMCRQTGTYRARSLDDLFLVPPFGSRMRAKGDRIAILSTSGGAGVAVADACENAGLELPTLAESTAEELAAVTPGFSSQNNPIDITGTFVVAMEQFSRSLEIIGSAAEFDLAILVMTVHPEDLANRIAEVVIDGADPALLGVVWAAGSQSHAARTALREAGFAVSESPDACARALGWLDRRRERPEVPRLIMQSDGGGEPEASAPSQILATLEDAGATVPSMARIESASELEPALARLRAPVVMKADAVDADHKTELGGVEIGIETVEQAHDTWGRFERLGLTRGGVVLQEQVSGSRELLMTVRTDEIFGLTLVLGIGGTLTEVVGRVGVMLPPIDAGLLRTVADEEGLGGFLEEFRGEAGVDIDALTRMANAQIEVARSVPGLRYLELNPVVIEAGGRPVAVDALVDVET